MSEGAGQEQTVSLSKILCGVLRSPVLRGRLATARSTPERILFRSALRLMKHICQRGPRDCGVAVAAMVAGIPFEQVLDRWFGCLTVEDGLRELALWRLLEDITQDAWIICSLRAPFPQVGDHCFEDCPVAVLLEGQDGTRHYVAIEGHDVYDPLLAAGCPLREYPNRGWRVQAIIKPREGKVSGLF